MPPNGRPAGGEHLNDLVDLEQAFFRPFGLLPELCWAPAAIQNGLPILQGKGGIEFKGGLDEPVETGNHEVVMPEEWKWVKRTAGTL